MTFRLFIPGVPKPQGSKTSGINRRTGKTFVREDNAGTKPWRKVMVAALQDDHGVPLARFESAVWVSLRFVFRRPKSHPINSLPTSKALGDVDKLTRNVLDALTQAKVIADDKFVVMIKNASKVYGPNPGLHIEVGAAVPNPFDLAAEIFGLPVAVIRGRTKEDGVIVPPGMTFNRFVVDEAVFGPAEPSPEAVVRQELSDAMTGRPRGGACACTESCRGFNVCRLLTRGGE